MLPVHLQGKDVLESGSTLVPNHIIVAENLHKVLRREKVTLP